MFVDIVTNVCLALLWVFIIEASKVSQPRYHMIFVNDDVP